jgi:hypothetical protein
MPHHRAATCTGFALVHRVLSRLVRLQHVWGIGIILGDGGYTAADQGRGYDLSLRLNSTSVTLIPSEGAQLD